MPQLHVLVGSTRPGRAGRPIAEWAADRAVAHGAFDVELIDLLDVGLPLLDEPNHPRLRQYTQPHTWEWSATVEAADAFIFVTPEYNHGYSPALKNAIDFLHDEWRYKPVGFVSYGGIAAGTRAVQQLKPIVSVLKMTPVTESVSIPFHAKLLDEDRRTLQATEAMDKAADGMLDELVRVETALRLLRSRQT